MAIRRIYVVNHSHTDIGYTDLQINALDTQVEHIRKVLKILAKPENIGYRWNCETLYPVACFLDEASEDERRDFFALVRSGEIGISLNWLNFTDLVDIPALKHCVDEVKKAFRDEGISLSVAMNADINGISMGHRDFLIDEGVTFLYTAVNATHGDAPIGKRHTYFRWENDVGKSLVVLNGEHYHLGNCLGIKSENSLRPFASYLLGNHFDEDKKAHLRSQIERYVEKLEAEGYPYDFLVVSVSGIFTDNAPPNSELIRNISAYNAENNGVKLEMVSLSELAEKILPKLGEIPTYHGDYTDWWADGVASTPSYTKHYLEARRIFRALNRFFPDSAVKYPAVYRRMCDSLLLFAEHTWGHSDSVAEPFESAVNNLDLQKASYAARAFEDAQHLWNVGMRRSDSTMRSYSSEGSFTVRATPTHGGLFPVEFIAGKSANALSVTDADGNKLVSQSYRMSRGLCTLFYDRFEAGEEKRYYYRKDEGVSELPAHIPGVLENEWFRLSWTTDGSVDTFIDKQTGRNLIIPDCPIFTPIYDRTPILDNRISTRGGAGLNRREANAVSSRGVVRSERLLYDGALYTEVELKMELDGCRECCLLLRLYRSSPRIEFTLRVAKELNDEIENLLMPLDLALENRVLWLRKGGKNAFRPGLDRLPHTCVDYSISDDGVLLSDGNRIFAVTSKDAPLYGFGEPSWHEQFFFAGENLNSRHVYSWIMDNLWETNFKLDLSGYHEFRYAVDMLPAMPADEAFELMSEQGYGVAVSMDEDETMI